jgi:hypothetical protein
MMTTQTNTRIKTRTKTRTKENDCHSLSKKEIQKKEYAKNSKVRSREIAKMRENKNSFTETYVVDSYDYNYSGYEYCRGCKVWGCKHGYGCGWRLWMVWKPINGLAHYVRHYMDYELASLCLKK